MKLLEYKTIPPIMKSTIYAVTVFALLSLLASAVFGQELDTSTSTPTISTVDIISAFDTYFINQKEEEYSLLFDLNPEGYRPRSSVKDFFFKTEAENFDFLYGKLQAMDDKLNQLLRICSK